MQVVGGDGARWFARASRRWRKRSQPRSFGAPRLVGNAARMVADRWPADAPPPARSTQQARARHRLGRVARRRGRSARRRRGRSICARPTRSRKTAAALPRRCIMIGWLSALFAPAAASDRARDACATPQGCRSCTARRFIAAGARANSRACLPNATCSRIALMLGRTLIGFIISRLAADEAEILSVAVAAAQRGRGLFARSARDTISGILRGSASAACFWKWKRTISRRVRLYQARGLCDGRTPGTVLPRRARRAIERPDHATRLVLTRKRCQNSDGESGMSRSLQVSDR